jgi:hypothetical protein
MLRKVETAAAWFAAILERSKLGIAIAAMIKMIATTINSSIKEKPRVLFMDDFSLQTHWCKGILGAKPATLFNPRSPFPFGQAKIIMNQ